MSNLLWVWLFSVFVSFLSGMAIGSILGVLLPDLRSINSAMPIVALPIVLVGGSFVTV